MSSKTIMIKYMILGKLNCRELILSLAFIPGLLFLNNQTYGQNSSVAIGKLQPQDNAVLLLFSPEKNQGLIIPVSYRSSIAAPEQGMIVFDDQEKKVFYFDGSNWKELGAPGLNSNSSSLHIELNGNNLEIYDGTSMVNSSSFTETAPVPDEVLTWDGDKWAPGQITISPSKVVGEIAVGVVPKGSLSGLVESSILDYGNGVSILNNVFIEKALAVGSLSNFGLPGQVLTSNGTGLAPAWTLISGDATLAGDGSFLISPGTINSTKILDGSISAADLGNMGAVNGQVLKWNQTNNRWEPGSDNTGTGTVATLNNGEILLGDGTGNFALTMGGDAAINSATGVVTISDEAITSAKIQDGTISTTDVGDAQITDAKINSVSAGKVTGISNNIVPRSNGAGLVDGTIEDDGMNIAIGATINTQMKLRVRNTSSVNNYSYGIYSLVANAPGSNIGVLGYGISSTGSEARGLNGIASGTGLNIGVYGGTLSGGANSWAGFFAGKVLVETDLYIRNGIALGSGNNFGTAGQVLTSNGAGFPASWTTSGGSGFSTDNAIPVGDGTGMVASQIVDDGAQLGIGIAPDAAAKLSLSTDNHFFTLYAENERVTGSTNSGIVGSARNSTSGNIGVWGDAVFPTSGDNIGIYGEAFGGNKNWAGYFAGGYRHNRRACFWSSPGFWHNRAGAHLKWSQRCTIVDNTRWQPSRNKFGPAIRRRRNQ